MSSGSYFPPPVSAVAIPKKSGGERILGVPTVSDRIAQTVATLVLNPILEPHFHEEFVWVQCQQASKQQASKSGTGRDTQALLAVWLGVGVRNSRSVQ